MSGPGVGSGGGKAPIKPPAAKPPATKPPSPSPVKAPASAGKRGKPPAVRRQTAVNPAPPGKANEQRGRDLPSAAGPAKDAPTGGAAPGAHLSGNPPARDVQFARPGKPMPPASAGEGRSRADRPGAAVDPAPPGAANTRRRADAPAAVAPPAAISPAAPASASPGTARTIAVPSAPAGSTPDASAPAPPAPAGMQPPAEPGPTSTGDETLARISPSRDQPSPPAPDAKVEGAATFDAAAALRRAQQLTKDSKRSGSSASTGTLYDATQSWLRDAAPDPLADAILERDEPQAAHPVADGPQADARGNPAPASKPDAVEPQQVKSRQHAGKGKRRERSPSPRQGVQPGPKPSKLSVAPNGTVRLVQPDGAVQQRDPDGTATFTSPSGSTFKALSDGTVVAAVDVRVKPAARGGMEGNTRDGYTVTAHDGDLTVRSPDGESSGITRDSASWVSGGELLYEPGEPAPPADGSSTSTSAALGSSAAASPSPAHVPQPGTGPGAPRESQRDDLATQTAHALGSDISDELSKFVSGLHESVKGGAESLMPKGIYRLFSGEGTEDLANAADTVQRPGWTLIRTPEGQKAKELYDAAMARRFGNGPPGRLPTEEYDAIFGPPSRKYAALQGLSEKELEVFLNSPRPNSIYMKVEVPTLGWAGTGVGFLMGASGIMSIFSASKVDNPRVQAIGITGGAAEVAGGALYISGSWAVVPRILNIGANLSRFGGGAALFTLSGYNFISDVEREDVGSAVGDAAATATGLFVLIGAVAAPAAALGGSFMLSYEGTRAVDTAIGISDDLSDRGVRVETRLKNDLGAPDWLSHATGFAAAAPIVGAPVEVLVEAANETKDLVKGVAGVAEDAVGMVGNGIDWFISDDVPIIPALLSSSVLQQLSDRRPCVFGPPAPQSSGALGHGYPPDQETPPLDRSH